MTALKPSNETLTFSSASKKSVFVMVPASLFRRHRAGLTLSGASSRFAFMSLGRSWSVTRPASPRGNANTTAMNNPPIANSQSSGNDSENSVLPQLTRSVPATAPTSE